MVERVKGDSELKEAWKRSWAVVDHVFCRLGVAWYVHPFSIGASMFE